MAWPFVSAYLLLAMALSALTTWAVGWCTPSDATLRINDFRLAAVDWLRDVIVPQTVRVLARTFFPGTPVWTLYLRWNGARIDRGVFVNTLSIMDHNLLEVGDDPIIGSDVHLSGHTVEKGVIKTVTLRIERRVTLGSHSVIGVGAAVGDDSEVGALSFVPPYTRLAAGGGHVGISIQRLDPRSVSGGEHVRRGRAS